ncbi:Mur ligase domain-containing protein, partial [Bradyrhizobium sp. SHOUNA76]|uniref:Mur ligase domain-containing protein n=2 Tax=unclassified Bradyrhizobium TaxID=2631580 RepID=UPI001FF10622
MKLSDLLGNDAAIEPAVAALDVTGLALDSRVVKPGDLFFALAGSKTDGARFIDAAIAAGAVAVVGDHAPDGSKVPFITVANPRRALALAAASFFPAQPATVEAVTGTSG